MQNKHLKSPNVQFTPKRSQETQGTFSTWDRANKYFRKIIYWTSRFKTSALQNTLLGQWKENQRMGSCICKSRFEKGSVSRIYKELKLRKTNNPITTDGKDLNRHFTKKDKDAERAMKKMSMINRFWRRWKFKLQSRQQRCRAWFPTVGSGGEVGGDCIATLKNGLAAS